MPLKVIDPLTPNFEPSKVRLDSTVAFGAVKFSVITPLSVVPVKANVPDAPDTPDVPEVPLVPLVPEVPDVPLPPAAPSKLVVHDEKEPVPSIFTISNTSCPVE